MSKGKVPHDWFQMYDETSVWSVAPRLPHLRSEILQKYKLEMIRNGDLFEPKADNCLFLFLFTIDKSQALN